MFSNINSFSKITRICIRVSNGFNQDPNRPDLGQTCLQSKEKLIRLIKCFTCVLKMYSHENEISNPKTRNSYFFLNEPNLLP